VYPASARNCAQGRTLDGVPVNPWLMTTPTGPPSAAKGWVSGLPGITATWFSSLLVGLVRVGPLHHAWQLARRRPNKDRGLDLA